MSAQQIVSLDPFSSDEWSVAPRAMCMDIGISHLNHLSDALLAACATESELADLPGFDPGVSVWLDAAEEGWAVAWAAAEAVAVTSGDTSSADWCRRLGQAVIEILEADAPAIAQTGFERLEALFRDLPPTLRVLKASTLSPLRRSLNRLSELCPLIEAQAEVRCAPILN